MRFKPIMVGVVSLTIATCSTSTALAAEQNPKTISDEITEIDKKENQAQFQSFKGKITEITERDNGTYLVSVIREEEKLAKLVISNDTYIYGDGELEVGAVITGYYDIDKPMIMIYPPQYSAAVIAFADEDRAEQLKVGFFDENLVSRDNKLKLNLSEETEVITINGDSYDGELVNKKLAVIYDASTKRIPAQTTPSQIVVLPEDEVEEEDTANDEEEVVQSQFQSFKGEITEITERDNGVYLVSVISEEEKPAKFVISKDTYLYGEDELEVGTVITGYYDTEKPMIMIYPPQYSVAVVAFENENEGQTEQLKVDLFDEKLVSRDNKLKLQISEETEVTTVDGEGYQGELVNKKLAVIYDVSTKSIPAQTTPLKVVVLPEEQAEDTFVVQDGEEINSIMINGMTLDAPSVHINENGTIMVPIRAVAEALGIDVKWKNDTQTVILDKEDSFSVGKDNYTYKRMKNVSLDEVPIIVERNTYVPLTFFSQVVQLKDIEIVKGQVTINSEN